MLKMYQGSYLTKQARSMQQFLTLPTSPSKNTEKTGVQKEWLQSTRRLSWRRGDTDLGGGAESLTLAQRRAQM